MDKSIFRLRRRRRNHNEEAEAPTGGGRAGAETTAAPIPAPMVGTAASTAPTLTTNHSFSSSSRNDEDPERISLGEQAESDVAVVGTRTQHGAAAAPIVHVSPRPHHFSAETWWMVDLEADPAHGATRLVKVCMRAYGWDIRKACSVLRAYRQFLFLKTTYEDYDATKFSPSSTVDMMWHQHILDVVNYVHDCALLCGGRIVGHDPAGSVQGWERDERLKATRQALLRHRNEIGIASEEWKELFVDNEDGAIANVAAAPVPHAAAPAPRAEVAPVPRAVVDPAPDVEEAPGHLSRPDKEARTIQLHVRPRIGPSFTITVNPKWGRLSDLYDAVGDKLGVYSRMFRLSSGGRQINRDVSTTPQAFGLTDQSTIDVTMTTAALASTHSPDYPESAIRLCFKTLTGQTFRIEVWPDSGRLLDLFDEVRAKVGSPSRKIHLVIDGKELEKDEYKSIRTAGLTNEATIVVVIQLRGC